jgi:type II secretory ATPase GspE/PulE/Tfp pilus assembly ATPase PilB-like protein
MLRQDPDVIVIGEIRDRETAEIAIRAALTGHIVISTLHTNDSVSSLSRLMDMGIEPYLIASSLLGILSQRLVRTLCPHCRKATPMDDNLRNLVGVDLIAQNQLVGEAVGCPRCAEQGYRGRSAIYELLTPTREVKEAITLRRSDADVLALLKANGFTSLREDGIKQAIALVTSIDEILKQTF